MSAYYLASCTATKTFNDHKTQLATDCVLLSSFILYLHLLLSLTNLRFPSKYQSIFFFACSGNSYVKGEANPVTGRGGP
jgi:hypothetical protein